MISLFRKLVCDEYDITIDEFNSRTKKRDIVEARALFYKICMDAGIGNKEAVMFMGRSIQSTRTYEDLLSGYISKAFKNKYAHCSPIAHQIVRRCKYPSPIHPITRYTKAEEIRILNAIESAKCFMRRYCGEIVKFKK